jgi:hypothetical protein
MLGKLKHIDNEILWGAVWSPPDDIKLRPSFVEQRRQLRIPTNVLVWILAKPYAAVGNSKFDSIRSEVPDVLMSRLSASLPPRQPFHEPVHDYGPACGCIRLVAKRNRRANFRKDPVLNRPRIVAVAGRHCAVDRESPAFAGRDTLRGQFGAALSPHTWVAEIASTVS